MSTETETSEQDVNATASEESSEPTSEQDDDAEASDDESGDDESDDDESDDDDDKRKSSDKPKKVKIEFEASMPRDEAVSYFEAVVGGLRSGRVEFRQKGETLILTPPDQLEVEVKAQAKGNKAKIVFEIEWSDQNRPLEIIN